MESSEELSVVHGGHCLLSKGFYPFQILSCILILAMLGPCATRNHLVLCADGIQSNLGQDAGQSNANGAISSAIQFPGSDTLSDDGHKSFLRCSALKNICSNTNFLCFPSTLSSLLAKDGECKEDIFKVTEFSDVSIPAKGTVSHNIGDANSSWFAAHATHKLSNGRVVSCLLNSSRKIVDQLPLQHANVNWTHCKGSMFPKVDKNSSLSEPDIIDASSSPHVTFTPTALDWGESSLYAPSVAVLTVTNRCNGSILDIYEPFSSNSQFYAYNFKEISLAPGESGSLSFVFLPKWLGSSSAHLVLQTSFGGFLIHAKGRACGSLYKIQPLAGTDYLPDGILTKSISLYNPFDAVLDVAELTAWVAISSENTSNPIHVICKMEALHVSAQISSMFDGNEWLHVKDNELGLPIMGIRPYGKWQIDAHGTERIMEMQLPNVEGKVFGAFCLQLQSSSLGRTDTVIIPIEEETYGRISDNSLPRSISASLDFVTVSDENHEIGSIAAILSLNNVGSHVLNVAKISEVTEGQKLFKVKYTKGLILFPGTFTHVAVITRVHLGDSHGSLSRFASLDCKLLILTNDSLNPQIEIPCLDLVPSYIRHNLSSPSFIPPESSYFGSELQGQMKTNENSKTGINFQVSHSVKWKVSQFFEADELLLRNWKSQGSASSISILEEDLISFSTVKIGARASKWISVKNPSERPALMQLILNAGALIDQCRAAEKTLLDTVSINFVHYDSTTARDGFSIQETAITEVCVHPHGKALLGPIVFSPSDRCVWRSSALIRNNLSGIEWLHLQGFGGSMSLALLDGYEHVQKLEFDLDLLAPINLSMSETTFQLGKTKSACSQSLLKVLNAQNVGDVTLEVRKIDVSGTGCGLDGFVVHPCEGFSLNPGESRKLLISYQTDFSAFVIHRDLELALSTGIIVIPMKARLPAYMLAICRKSLIWVHIRILSIVIVFIALIFLLFLYRIIIQSTIEGSWDCFFKIEDNPTIILSNNDISSFSKKRNDRDSWNSEMDSVAGRSNCSVVANGVETSAQLVQCKLNEKEQGPASSHPKIKPLLQSPTDKSMAETEGSPLLETPTSSDLRVRIQKERKRRAAGTFSGITGKFELSSQSGNSAPPSPSGFFSPKQSEISSHDLNRSVGAQEKLLDVAQNKSSVEERVFEDAVEEKLQEADVPSFKNNWPCSVNKQLSIPKNMTSSLDLRRSTSSPDSGWKACGSVENSFFSSFPSAIGSHARAPGFNISKGEPLKNSFCFGEKFTYDIWGNNFCAFDLDKQNDSPQVTDAQEGESQSLFARSPMSVLQKLPERKKKRSQILCVTTIFPRYLLLIGPKKG